MNSIALRFLVLWMSLGWITQHSVFASVSYLYLAYITMFILFVVYGVQRIGGGIDHIAVVGAPFFLYLCLSYVVVGNMESATYWFVSFIILITAKRGVLTETFPYTLLLVCGLMATTGVLFQFVYPGYYATHIAGLFTYESALEWDVDAATIVAYNGFIYQTGLSAQLIVLGMIMLLFGKHQFVRLQQNKYLKIIVLLIMFAALFLTAKRMNSTLAVVIVCIYYVFSGKKSRFGNKIAAIIFVAAILSAIMYYISVHVNELIDNALFGRFARSYIEVTQGGDISSGRDYLWSQAMLLFRSSPLVGIGIGRFAQIHGTMVHNACLQMLCECGIVGFLFMIIPMVYCLFVTIRRCMMDSITPCYSSLLLSFTLQVAFIMQGITDNPTSNLTDFPMYAVALAMLVDYKQKYNKQQSLRMITV